MKPDIDILIVQLRDGRATTRAEAARTLSEYPSALARNDLARCLQDSDENVRYWATWALAALGRERDMDLVAAQLQDADAGVRMIAAKALAGKPHPRAAVHLLRVIDDSSDNVSYWVSAALAALGDRVLARLINLLGSQSWHQRSAAARTIIRLGSSAVIEVARALKKNDRNIRYWALYILGELRDRRAAPMVVPFLSSPDSDLVVRAARALGLLGARGAIPRLVGLLAHKDENVRLAAVEALADFGDYSVKVLTDLLASDRRTVRVSATMSLARVGDTALRHILSQLRDESSDLRYWAIRALARFDNPAIVPVLVDLLDDERFDIQLAAATALRNYSLPPKIALSIVSRFSNPNWRVRQALAESLAMQSGLNAGLFASGLEDPCEDVRFWSAWVLGRLGDPDAVPLLMKRFDDPAWPVRKRAAESISMIGPAAAPFLAACLSGENDGNRRFWASRALVGIGNVDLLPELVPLLGDPDWSIRRNAEEALLVIGGPAVPALLTALRTDSSRVMRENVSHCLVKMSELDVDTVATLLQFRDPDLNYWTTFILSKRGEQSIPCLEKILLSGEERVRYQALKAMGGIDSPVTHMRCIELLEDEYLSLRRVAAEILGRLRVRSSVSALVKAARDGSDYLRMVILKSLGRIGDKEALPLLLDSLASERWDIRKEAVAALGDMKAREAVQPLLKLLDDPGSRDLRPFVVETLGVLEDLRAVKPLLELVESEKEDEELLLVTIQALGRLGAPEAFDSLAPLAESSSWAIRRAVLEAIGSLGSVPDLGPVKRAVDSDDPILRATARRVLKELLGAERWQDYMELTVKRALLEPAEEHYRRALELRGQGDLDAAAAHVRTALRCRRKAAYYSLLGAIHTERNRFDLARRNLEKALALDAGDVVSMSKLAAVYAKQGRRLKAVELLKRILALPSLPDKLRRSAERTLERIRSSVSKV